MISNRRPLLFLALVLGIGFTMTLCAKGAPVHPVLEKHCLNCHGGNKPKAELDFADPKTFVGVDVAYAFTTKKILDPGKPDSSYIIEAISDPDAEITMPPKGKPPLTPADVQWLKNWITAGADSKNFGEPVVAKPKDPKPTPVPVAGGEQDPNDPVPATVMQLVREKCFNCHGPAVVKPKGGFQITKSASLLRYIVPGRPEKSELLLRLDPQLAAEHKIDLQRMPPPDAGEPVSAAALDAVRKWIGKEPSIPPPPQNKIGTEYVFKTILDDVRDLAAAREPVKHYRYFSLNHLLLTGITEEELQHHRDAFVLVLNHLTTEGGVVIPKAIDDRDTIFRVNIMELGWSKNPHNQLKGQGRTKLDFHDMLLLEYPYGITRSDLPLFDQLAREYIEVADLVRPIAYVNADWFVCKAAVPPLYDDFLQLPMKLSELEERFGIDRARNVRSEAALRAGRLVSGVSKNARVAERHSGRTAYYWLSHDFATNLNSRNAFRDPVGFNADGGEVVFALPNGMQGFYIANAAGDRLSEAPKEIVTDAHEQDGIVRTGLSCIRCHDTGGLHPFHDEMADYIQNLGANPGFDKNKALRLYRGDAALQTALQRDRETYQRGLRGLFQDREISPQVVLSAVSSRYMYRPLDTLAMAAELGYSSVDKAKSIQFVPALQQLGANGLGVRRDAWEQNFPGAVRALDRGQPVLPIDGISAADYQPEDAPNLTLSTKSGKNRFAAGQNYELKVTNHSAQPVHVEFIWRGPTGRIIAVDHPKIKTVLAANETYVLPPIRMTAAAGNEKWSVLADFSAFDKGRHFSNSEADRQVGYHVGDRYVHEALIPKPMGTVRNMSRTSFELECIP